MKACVILFLCSRSLTLGFCFHVSILYVKTRWGAKEMDQSVLRALTAFPEDQVQLSALTCWLTTLNVSPWGRQGVQCPFLTPIGAHIHNAKKNMHNNYTRLKKKSWNGWARWCRLSTSALGRHRQAYLCEFKASLIYILSSRSRTAKQSWNGTKLKWFNSF